MRCVLSVNLQRQALLRSGTALLIRRLRMRKRWLTQGLTAVAAVPLYKEDLSEKLPRLTWANRGFTALP